MKKSILLSIDLKKNDIDKNTNQLKSTFQKK